jgi:hypothetical protein
MIYGHRFLDKKKYAANEDTVSKAEKEKKTEKNHGQQGHNLSMAKKEKEKNRKKETLTKSLYGKKKGKNLWPMRT